MDVLPIPPTDRQSPVPNLRTRTYFIVKDRLDVAALRNALDKLIREHWRKLGSRVVLNPKTKIYEYHLPQTFPDKYELFRWSTQEKDEPIEKAGPSLKAPLTDTLAFLPPMNEYEAVFRPSSWPHHLADDPADSPLLYVHVSLYEDASVLALSYPHILGDQLGTASFIKAWMGVLRGEAPPPMLGYDADPLPNEKQWSEYPKEEVHRKGKMRVRRGVEYFFVILPFIPDLVFNAEEVHHNLFVPHSLVRSLRQRAAKELEAAHGGDPGISDGDILTGLLTKFNRIHRSSTKTICLSQSMNLRGRIPLLSGPERDGFIHNGLIYATSRFQIAPDTPLSEIAYQNRKAIEYAMTPEWVNINLAVTREMVRRKQPLHICEPFDTSFSVTSWPVAWKGLDFSSAVAVDEKEKAKNGGKKTDLFVIGRSNEIKTPHRYHSTIMNRSDDGYWIDAGWSKKNFEAIQKYLATDPKLEKI